MPTPRLHMIESGRGPTVVLLHAAASSSAAWRAVIRQLEPRARLRAPDLLGDGASPPAPTLDDVVGDDLDALHALIDGPCVLVGHSYGALLALELARARPALPLTSLVLIEPVALHLLADAPPDAGADATARVASLCRERLAAGCLAEAAATFVDHWSGAAAYARLPDASRAAIARTLPKVVAGIASIQRLPARLADYAAITTPTVLVRGAHSPAASRWISAALAATLPRAECIDLAGAGHMSPLTHPELIASVIDRALATA